MVSLQSAYSIIALLNQYHYIKSKYIVWTEKQLQLFDSLPRNSWFLQSPYLDCAMDPAWRKMVTLAAKASSIGLCHTHSLLGSQAGLCCLCVFYCPQLCASFDILPEHADKLINRVLHHYVKAYLPEFELLHHWRDISGFRHCYRIPLWIDSRELEATCACTCWYTIASAGCKTVISYNCNGHRSRGIKPCWYHQAFHLPESWVLSVDWSLSRATLCNFLPQCWSVSGISYRCPRLYTVFSLIVGIMPPQYRT